MIVDLDEDDHRFSLKKLFALVHQRQQHPPASLQPYYIVRVDAPPAVSTITTTADGCFVTVESGPYPNLALALEALQNPRERVRGAGDSQGWDKPLLMRAPFAEES